MLDKLLTLFRNPQADVEITSDDGRTAVAAILVHAARGDDDYAESEKRQIDRILATRYGLSPEAATALRAEGEAAEARALDLHQFTRAVKRAVPFEERIAVVEAVWEIAYADGVRDDSEAGLVRKLCGLLYVEDRDAGLARKRVAERLGLE